MTEIDNNRTKARSIYSEFSDIHNRNNNESTDDAQSLYSDSENLDLVEVY